jgi:putative transposase
MPNSSNYNPTLHHRKSIRLKGYNYSNEGLYFITICCKDNLCLFGKIMDSEMKLNDAGRMIAKWYKELEHKFPEIKCLESIVMPNHFHCIIEIVGADLRVCPNEIADLSDCPNKNTTLDVKNKNIEGEHIGSPLHRVVQWFKTMSTNEYIRGVKTLGWQTFNGKLWQRNYFEHIIRNESSYQKISNYINNNPSKWEEDKFFTI